MTETQLFLIILGMFAVTFPVRFIPLVCFNRSRVPRVVKVWLGYVPLAIFAALLTQILVGGEIENFLFQKNLPLLISCLATILITVKTRSIGWGMGLGFAIFLALTACWKTEGI